MRVFNRKKKLLSDLLCFVGESAFFLIRILTLKIFKPTMMPDGVRKILVIEVFGIGDLILATPTFEALKSVYPNTCLHLLTLPEYSPLVMNHRFIDRTMYFKCPWRKESIHKWDYNELKNTVVALRNEKYDMVIDIRGDFRNILFSFFLGAKYRVAYDIGGGGFLLTHRVPYDPSGKHQVLVNLDVVRYLGGDVRKCCPNIHIDYRLVREMTGTMRRLGIESKDTVIGIHPGAANSLRKLSKEKLAELVRKFSNLDVKLLLIGGANDRRIVRHMLIAGNKNVYSLFPENLGLLVAAIKKLDLLICMDSAAGHIASAVGTPTISLFGPQDPTGWRPWGIKNKVVMFEPMPCRPCEQVKCVIQTPCIDKIDTHHVYTAALEKLSQAVPYHNLVE